MNNPLRDVDAVTCGKKTFRIGDKIAVEKFLPTEFFGRPDQYPMTITRIFFEHDSKAPLSASMAGIVMEKATQELVVMSGGRKNLQ